MEQQTTSKMEIIAQFLSSAEQFVAAVRELPEHSLDCAAAQGEWTIRQIVHHVSDDADAWCFAFKKAIASPGAPLRFEGFPGNERWFAALGFGERPAGAALDLILSHRRLMAEVAAYAEPALDEAFLEVFDDKGSSMGRWHAGQILEMLTGHTLQHLETVRSIRQKNGW